MRRITVLQVLNIVGVLGVIIVNYLAATLPINGVSTGQVSAEYTTYFTPAGFTFSIWSLIYLGLAGFAIYQAKGFPNPQKSGRQYITLRIGFLFFISCLANIAWIFAWHYYRIEIAAILMVLLLTLLIDINIRLKAVDLSKNSYWLVAVPFSLYLGWISVATIANVSVYLTYVEWGGFGIPEVTWAALLITIAGILGLFLIGRVPSVAGTLAVAWGLTGIYYKLSGAETAYYLQILIIVFVALILIGIARRIRNIRLSKA